MKTLKKKQMSDEWQETEIGRIPSDWTVTTLGSIANVLTDGSHFSPKPTLNGRFMASVKDMTYEGFDFSACKHISEEDFVSLKKAGCSPEKSDILISKDGANCLDIIFKYSQEEEIVVLSSIAIVRLKSEYSPSFYTHFLLSPVSQEIMRSWFISGSAIPRVVLKDFKEVPVPRLPLSEQNSISKVLATLDDKIALLRNQNETLEAIAQIIFKEWFVNFNFPDKNGKPYKDSGGKMVDSELGAIPDGWRVGELSSVADITIGRTPPRKESEWFSTNSKDIKWMSIKDLGNSGVYVNRTSEYLTSEAVERFNVPIIPENTVVVSFKLTVGRVAITTCKMLSNEAIAHIKLTPICSLSVPYVYSFLKRFDYNTLGSTSSIATAVNSKSIKGISVTIPLELVNKEFADTVSPLFAKIFSNISQTQPLLS